jgi:hypothetical protein
MTRAAKPLPNGTTTRKSLDQLGKSESTKPNSGQDEGGGALFPDQTRKNQAEGELTDHPPRKCYVRERTHTTGNLLSTANHIYWTKQRKSSLMSYTMKKPEQTFREIL